MCELSRQRFFFVYVHWFTDELLMLKRKCAFLDSALIWFIYLESEMTAESKLHCFRINVCLIVNLWKIKYCLISLTASYPLGNNLKKKIHITNVMPKNGPVFSQQQSSTKMLVTSPFIRLNCFCSVETLTSPSAVHSVSNCSC